MRKIPTLFVRNPQTHKIEPVLSEGCEWVLAGEGRATRKVDGTAVLIRGDKAWKRREVKPGRTPPPDFERVETDETTAKEVGWVPVRIGDPSDRYFVEGIGVPPPQGETFELVGPMVQNNTENLDRHTLIPHDSEMLHIAAPPQIAGLDAERAFEVLDAYLRDWPHEGVVWHHPDGRRAKIKRRDFGHLAARQSEAGPPALKAAEAAGSRAPTAIGNPGIGTTKR